MKKRPEKRTDETNLRLISQAKAAEMCGMTRAAIHNLVQRGRFGSVEVEGRDLVYLAEIEAFVVENESVAAGR